MPDETVQSLFEVASRRLKSADKPQAELDARLLMVAALGDGWTKERLLAHPEATVEAEAAERFLGYVERRLQHEPVALIVGQKEFFGHQFLVTTDVLQPRSESEALVESALEYIAEHPGRTVWRILDIGTGTGALAISLALELKKRGVNYQMVATDVSEAALQIARENAERYATDDVDFVLSDLLLAVPKQRFDIVLANLPYIPDGILPALEPEVKCEPIVALLGGADGLDYYRRLREEIVPYLGPESQLYFECAENQKDELRELFRSFQTTVIT